MIESDQNTWGKKWQILRRFWPGIELDQNKRNVTNFQDCTLVSEGLLEKSCLAPEDSMKILNANNKYISEEVLSLKDFMWSNRSVHVSKTVLHAKYIWMTEHDGYSLLILWFHLCVLPIEERSAAFSYLFVPELKNN